MGVYGENNGNLPVNGMKIYHLSLEKLCTKYGHFVRPVIIMLKKEAMKRDYADIHVGGWFTIESVSRKRPLHGY